MVTSLAHAGHHRVNDGSIRDHIRAGRRCGMHCGKQGRDPSWDRSPVFHGTPVCGALGKGLRWWRLEHLDYVQSQIHYVPPIESAEKPEPSEAVVGEVVDSCERIQP